MPLELGSDIAGSLRCPAHFCGVFAHKPSPGLVPLRGHQLPRTPEGLPVGAQIIGPALEDRTTLAFAKLIEREFGGFVGPPR